MFKNLQTTAKKIGAGIGILSIVASSLNAQQWVDVGSAGSISAGASSFNNLAIDAQGNYYVSYYDVSVQKGSVQKFNGTSWSYVGGTAGITTATATYNSLSLDATGNLYYTNQWGYPNSGMEVRKFNGTSWSLLSLPFTDTTNYQASAVAPNNVPFVYASVGLGTVKRLVNNVWEQVGPSNIAGGNPTHAEMVTGTNGKVYVCHISSGVKVYENNLTASATDPWTLVGGASVGNAFTEGTNATSDIAIGADNTLYVVYSSTSDNNRKLNVKKFDGTNWVQVGNANFGISNDLYNVSIAVTPSGKIYTVANGWSVNSGKNTVYEYNSTTNTWETFGGDFVSDGTATYNDLQYDAFNNTLVLTYSQSGVKVKKIQLPNTTPACSNADPGTNPGDTSCVTFTYKGQQVTYTTVRGADGKVWLQQNLGSSQVATSMADADSYGDLFQWGRWDDGHQNRNSATTTVPSTNNPTGLAGITSFILGNSPAWWSTNALSDLWNGANTSAITSTVSVDPCKAIGTGWKLPSQADWIAAVGAEGMSSAANAYTSKLKLPAAGYRSQSSGGFTYVGERGYYWSGDVANTGGKYLYNSTSLANPNSGGPRAQGQSVRCIKETTTGLGTSDIKKVTLGIYPNPTNGILNIKTDATIDKVNVTNILGQRMDVQFSNNRINIQSLQKGVYIVELLLKDGQKISKKVIKN
ncbi:T9SS type A sorting domain-containing protein [Chryseobacterium formosus]|uniref:T9SS type A sorting domain-containing protein n=1 Tax=Chryseobacterium formosus TaxID=1537363 RepID=A0ABT3XJY8_9FLAO|nr:T9SS type A sorting domain-containing protein [Chryseobacterium formosus]MCX8522455.1 T9SS type A sorting domain-containing protein [Chryseobacterium formosus]